jgi:hypothetical protein
MSASNDEGGQEFQVVPIEEAKEAIRKADEQHRARIKELLSIPSDGMTEVYREDWESFRVKVASRSDLFDPTADDTPVFRIYEDEVNGRLYLQRIDEV